MSKIAIGGDHAGFEYKGRLKIWLESIGHTVEDFGTFSSDSVDYPDFAHTVASAVEKEEYDQGILICGSANGVAMAANKHQGIRAAICWSDLLARLSREHNDANILCIPSRFVSYEVAEQTAKTFITTAFEGGRHGRRVDKISC